MKILFLHTEISGYFLAGATKLVELYGAEMHIVRYPINKEAPFKFAQQKNVFYYERREYDFEKLKNLVAQINPQLIYCAGWIDKDYLKISKQYFDKIPTVLGFDNKWENTLKQNIATLLSPFYITNKFSHCFVAGQQQRKYAQKLGFKNEQIFTGLYTADVDLFYSQSLINKESKTKFFPKKFIYTARYVRHKGIENLWNSFDEIQKENPNEWELWCLGTGDITAFQHPKIKHFGFVQPDAMSEIIRQTGVFVLPSYFEPWGVAVHEFAAAGFPLLCSTEVGAASQFLEDGKNGYLFETKNKNSMKNAMKKMINLSNEKLNEMSNKSIELAKELTPEIWATTVMKMVNGKL